MVVSTVGGKGLSFVAQVFLGWLLAKEDWGIYGIAISIAFFLQVFRDGGVRQLLVQRGATAYEDLAGPVFWMASAFNTATALLLAAASPLVAWAYHDHRLIGMLLVMGLSVPLSTPSVITSARLRIDLRFGDLARMTIWSAVIRYGGSVALAYAGMGPLAFVLPLPAVSVFESLYCQWKTGDRPWRRPADFSRWASLFGQSKWLVLLAAAMVALDLSDYPVIGLYLSPAMVGVYYFAYQLVAQTGALLAANIEGVLLPALSKLGDEPKRRRHAIMRSVRTLGLLASPASLVLGALVGPLEQLLWHGKWASAAPAVQIFALFYPARAVFVVASSYMLAAGKFRGAGLMILTLGLGRVIAAAAASLFTRDATGVAWWVGGYVGVSCPVALWYALHGAGVTWRDLAAALVPSWLLGLAAGAAALGVLQLWPAPHPGAGLALGGVIAGIVFAVGARALFAEGLRDVVLTAAPASLRTRVLTLLRLRTD
jgi:PST family polysaccharide transporter